MDGTLGFGKPQANSNVCEAAMLRFGFILHAIYELVCKKGIIECFK